VRRAYADWSRFDEDRRMLTRHHVELIEIPQRMGLVRKNAADIKMAVDAIELCFERDYITTFVLGTGDSDFTPLVHKLRELNRRVIGIGVEASTSALLPPACDEFLFYERLEGVEPAEARRASGRTSRAKPRPVVEEDSIADEEQPAARGEEPDLGVLVTQTLSGLSRSAGGPVLASMLKRAILRKDPTFSETTYGFRGFSELLRHLEEQGLVALTPGPGQGDPEVSFPTEARDEQAAFVLHAYPYRETSLIVEALTAEHGRVALVARGARRPRSELRGILQAFQPLTLSWAGGGELRTLLRAEWRGGLPLVAGSALLCGFYLNELLLKLLPREDPHPQIFSDYEAALTRLAAAAPQAPVLREFEVRLLSELGYALPLTHEADTGRPVDPSTRYYYAFDLGPRSTAAEPGRRYPLVRGATLLALAQHDYSTADAAAEAKRLMREVLDHYLEQRAIFSRRVVRDLQALDDDNGESEERRS